MNGTGAAPARGYNRKPEEVRLLGQNKAPATLGRSLIWIRGL
jgi:hypothetical protein